MRSKLRKSSVAVIFINPKVRCRKLEPHKKIFEIIAVKIADGERYDVIGRINRQRGTESAAAVGGENNKLIAAGLSRIKVSADQIGDAVAGHIRRQADRSVELKKRGRKSLEICSAALSRRFKRLENQQTEKKQTRKNIASRSIFKHNLSQFGCD